MVDDMNLTSQPGMIGTDPELHAQGTVWFSYVHVDGGVATKRYLSWHSYRDAHDSTFVGYVTKLYDAVDRDAAVAKGLRLIKAHHNTGGLTDE